MHPKALPGGGDPFAPPEGHTASYMRLIGHCWTGALWEPSEPRGQRKAQCSHSNPIELGSGATERE